MANILEFSGSHYHPTSPHPPHSCHLPTDAHWSHSLGSHQSGLRQHHVLPLLRQASQVLGEKLQVSTGCLVCLCVLGSLNYNLVIPSSLVYKFLYLFFHAAQSDRTPPTLDWTHSLKEILEVSVILLSKLIHVSKIPLPLPLSAQTPILIAWTVYFMSILLGFSRRTCVVILFLVAGVKSTVVISSS